MLHKIAKHATFVGDLIIPSNVTTIGTNAFVNCNFNGSLTLPDSLATVASDSFKNIIFSSATYYGETEPNCSTFQLYLSNLCVNAVFLHENSLCGIDICYKPTRSKVPPTNQFNSSHEFSISNHYSTSLNFERSKEFTPSTIVHSPSELFHETQEFQQTQVFMSKQSISFEDQQSKQSISFENHQSKQSNSFENQQSKLNGGEIAGITIGYIVLIAVIVVLVIFIVFKLKNANVNNKEDQFSAYDERNEEITGNISVI